MSVADVECDACDGVGGAIEWLDGYASPVACVKCGGTGRKEYQAFGAFGARRSGRLQPVRASGNHQVSEAQRVDNG